MSKETKTPVRPGRVPSASRAQIVECVLKMLKRDGTDALTFRAVQRETGLTGGALSRYFKNLADLEDEAAASVMAGLSPLKGGKSPLRQQLVKLGMEMFEIHRAHPYLVRARGPATAAIIGKHTRECINVMLEAGLDFESAVAAYGLVGHLAYSWGAQESIQADDQTIVAATTAYLQGIGDLAPRMAKLASGGDDATAYRKWLERYVEGFLSVAMTTSKRS